ncbi:MAG: energy transducer TonB [Endomicrobiaceae bacterium]|jgi:TonB family protein|nr:energy transducer TonB [Endomicrobiaceae bacterium]
MQIPVEVSFYSPGNEIEKKVKTIEKIETKPEKKIEPKIEEKKKEKVNKDDIALENNKKKEKAKVKEKEPAKEEKVLKEEKASNKTAGMGSPNKGIMIENADFKYSYYTSQIVKKISRNWQWSTVDSSYRALVYFKILKDGTVSSCIIKESSGDESFDQNALRAVELASPFAPLPDAYKEDSLGVYFEFKFR